MPAQVDRKVVETSWKGKSLPLIWIQGDLMKIPNGFRWFRLTFTILFQVEKKNTRCKKSKSVTCACADWWIDCQLSTVTFGRQPLLLRPRNSPRRSRKPIRMVGERAIYRVSDSVKAPFLPLKIVFESIFSFKNKSKSLFELIKQILIINWPTARHFREKIG